MNDMSENILKIVQDSCNEILFSSKSKEEKSSMMNVSQLFMKVSQIVPKE